jgi:hypothetical protein
VPRTSLSRHGWPSAGPCSRAWRARSRVVHSSWGYPRSFAFRRARDTSHALASAVISLCPAADDHRAPRTVRRPGPVQDTAEPADDAVPELGRPQRKRDLCGRLAARRFSSRPRDQCQLRHICIANRQLNHPPPCRHDLRPRSANPRPGYRAMESA